MNFDRETEALIVHYVKKDRVSNLFRINNYSVVTELNHKFIESYEEEE